MTREETIKTLDTLIVFLNGCLLHNYSLNYIKVNIIQSLEKTRASAATVNSIKNVEIEEYTPIIHQIYGSRRIGEIKKETYKEIIQSMINILRSEREAQVQAVQDEAQKVNLIQQKRSNRIQICTLVFTVATLVATVVMLVKSFIN